MNRVTLKVKSIIFRVVEPLLSLVPRNSNIILFSSWFGEKYNDSPMYLYEYMMIHSNKKIYWYTKNKTLYRELKNQRKNVLYGFSPLAIYYHLRAKVFVSSLHFADFHPLFMGGGILYDLDHGIPNKFVFFKETPINIAWQEHQYFLRKYIKVYLLATNYRLMTVYKDCYDIPKERILFGNKPRTDALFLQSLRSGRNLIIDRIKNGKKAIVYMPTHRSAGKKNINCKEILDFDYIEQLCIDSDAVFLIKKHFFHSKEREELSKYNRIIDITNFPNLDPEVILYQADVLISDYSSSYIDYLLLDRPIMLYVYDEEDFLENERDMYVKLSENDVGYKVKTKSEFNEKLSVIVSDWKDLKHLEGRQELRKLYFDKHLNNGHACETSVQNIDSIISGSIDNHWNDEFL